MIDNIDELPVIVSGEEIREMKNEIEEKEDILDVYNEIFKHVELFLTYWYKNSSEFGKIKDNFNEGDEPCELRLKDDRIKIKIIKDNEKN